MRIRIGGKNFEIFTETSEHQITVLAIICITILDLYALSKGFDTTLTSTVIGIIAGLAGFRAGRGKKKGKEEEK
jgi:uncharacterized membrane protein